MSQLRRYESLFIIHPDHLEEKDQVFSRLKEIVEKAGGQVVKIEEWGLKKLAYPIQKKKQGFYVLAEFGGPPELPRSLESFMRIDERVIRFVIVKLDDHFVPETGQAEAA
ncbi:30S ribosomal protein S6 [Thermosulfuriphilus ammonigenes]|uniref:Small ribosomal subunit protein bS6 n=1 Tax=Thermosulfuriphilus ammonigenes TaxID=1936021 RepID=A0A6G7PWX8_9BACT|nr:30S ribosomal protein S6 [Thermosulfuriphilus ammonigenes]MBA2847777.1 small subunit ribosomal protein S6 [Thermosulfuriphilus ammonigenes]QIJ72021.1 30S ribosomal protein S6 [Thermosulfuriphilus ammonigenes]HFB83453.1 30S ribosomal protein S6 [Thermodesulfatator sp.]